MMLSVETVRMQARTAKADVEAALDRIGWRWSSGLNRLIDVWVVVIEERSSCELQRPRRSPVFFG
jgi:hypothetical protein